ncbi:ABC transporter substrate-binding protein [Aeromicrobium sp. CF4.19]|uniref:peptide ABC transporter substrate-binding protein n=1 Tax=Aeromicrobium sp. CF4.19 TaxID=3373082 RepID=UPI003EE66E13
MALVAAGSLVLAACGGGDDGDGGGSTDAVITSYSVQPQNPLIPTNTNEVGGGNIVDLVFAGLISYTVDGETELEVAESIESEDNQTWTVTLNEGWEFSDGTAVTADSFVDAWNYGANPENEQLSAYFFYPIEGTTADGTIDGGGEEISGLEVVDDTSFTITLKQAEADFPGRLGYSAYFPLPESAFEDMEAFGDAPIGNGPYTLDGLDDNSEARLLPNDSYDGNRPAMNGGVTLKFYTDPDSAFSDVQAGNLDVLDDVPPSALTTYEDDDSIQAISQPGSVNSTITIPSSLPGFGENDEGKLRRQAISRAINREEICDAIFDGANIPSTDFSSPLMPGYTEDIEGADVLQFDAEEAQDLWDQANEIAEFDGEFVLAYNGDGPGNKEWVEAAVNQINNTLDIDAEPQAYATFAELREKVTDRSIGTAFRTGWQPDYPSIYNYLGPIFGTGAGSNDGDYSNEEFDETIQSAAGAQDEEERYQLLADAQAILFEDLPAIPLWNQSIAAAAADGVENVEFNWQNKPELQNVTK